MYNKIKKFDANKTNPFFESLVTNIQVGNKNIIAGSSNKLLVNKDTGEVEAHTVFMKNQKVDKNSFIKIYVKNISQFFDLPSSAMKVLWYIFSITRIGIDTIYFDMTACKEFTKYSSKATITNALAQLIEHKFIARSTSVNLYFINPTIFFNGNRISFINSYYKEKESLGELDS